MSTLVKSPLAFIYDRHATPTKGILLLRLGACHDYIETRGYEFGGDWVDGGDDALTDDHRPKFDEMHDEMLAAHKQGREVVCVVVSWDRLSRDAWSRRIFVRRICLAGGRVETIAGESTDDPKLGRLTSTPSAS